MLVKGIALPVVVRQDTSLRVVRYVGPATLAVLRDPQLPYLGPELAEHYDAALYYKILMENRDLLGPSEFFKLI